jgi:hypothetical protein
VICRLVFDRSWILRSSSRLSFSSSRLMLLAGGISCS